MKMHALWWWIDRWRKSTAYMDMTLEQQGAYRNLLDEAALRGGPLPNDERVLAKACGDAKAWKRLRDVLLARFTLKPEGWRHDTLDEVLAQSDRRRVNQENYRKRRANKVDNEADNKSDNKPASPISHLLSPIVVPTEPPPYVRRPDARSKRPIYCGQRLTVFEFTLDDLIKMLGVNYEHFGLDKWFETLDRRVVETDMVLKPRDGGAWVLGETFLEARRRGLPIAVADVPTNGKLTSRLAAALAEIEAENPS